MKDQHFDPQNPAKQVFYFSNLTYAHLVQNEAEAAHRRSTLHADPSLDQYHLIIRPEVKK